MVTTNRTPRKGDVRCQLTWNQLDSGIDWPAVAARIAEAREVAGLTQAELALAIGYSRGQVNRLEAGAPIELRALELLAPKISRSVKWLLFGDVVPVDVEAIIARARADALKEAQGVISDAISQLRLSAEAAAAVPSPQGTIPALDLENAGRVLALSEAHGRDLAKTPATKKAAPRRKKKKNSQE